MTDTEILDYLQDAYTLRRGMACDARIGSVFFTLGTRPGTLREILIRAIEADQQRVTQAVTRKLTNA